MVRIDPKPNLVEHKEAAVVSDKAKLIPSKEVWNVIRKAVANRGEYRTDKLDPLELIATPASYVKAEKEWDEETRENEEKTLRILEKKQELLDKLYLDEFDNGQDAIEATKKACEG